MEKIRLDLDDLAVQSFSVSDEQKGQRGTVQGKEWTQPEDGCWYESYPEDTCYQSCDQLWGCGGGGGGGSGGCYGASFLASAC